MIHLDQYIGNWGRFQCGVVVMAMVPIALAGAFTTITVFTAAIPNFRCRVSEIDNTTNMTSYDDVFSNPQHVLRYPLDQSSDWGRKTTHCSYCPTDLIKNGSSCTKKEAVQCQNGIVYDQSIFHNSIATQFDITCDGWRPEMLPTCFMIGVMLSCLIFTPLSDRWGRKPIFAFSCIGQFITLATLPLLPQFWMLCVCNLLSGAFNYGSYLIGFVIAMEYVNGTARSVTGIMCQCSYAIGFMLCGLTAYFIRDWKLLHWACALPTVLLIPISWWMPESILWLEINDQDKAFYLIRKVAKINGKKIDSNLLMDELKPTQTVHRKSSVMNLVKYPVLVKNALISFYTWFVTCLVLYGLVFGSESLPGNLYVNIQLLGLMDLIGTVPIALPMMHKLGRRMSTIICFTVSGSACIIQGFVITEYPACTVAMSLIGKLTITTILVIIYSYSGELFPTVLRGTMMGGASLCGRLGGATASHLVALGTRVNSRIPPLTFGVLCLTSALFTCFLPETANRPLTDSLDGAANLGKVDKTKDLINA